MVQILRPGFNDWNEIARHYEPWARGVNETTLLGVAQALVETGLRDKGYSFINLDWSADPNTVAAHSRARLGDSSHL